MHFYMPFSHSYTNMWFNAMKYIANTYTLFKIAIYADKKKTYK